MDSAESSQGDSHTSSPPPLKRQHYEIDDEDDDDEFPNTLEGFGYRFNEFGQLRHTETGVSYQFQVRKEDHEYNQRRYEALGNVITEYVYNLVVTEGKLKKVNIPIDASPNEPQTFVFLSEDALTNRDRLLVLIHGSGVVRAGQWARRLIINDCLNSGTQLPFIKRAQGLGYGVIVLNTNDNSREENNEKKYIRDSEKPENHAMYVWEHFVQKAAAEYVAVVAHSYGGILTVNLANHFQKAFQERVFAVAFTDSVHNLRHQMVPQNLVQWLQRVSRNWVSSQLPLDTPLSTGDSNEIPCVSAGHQQHEMTSWSSFASIFEFLDNRYRRVLTEGMEDTGYRSAARGDL